MTLMAFISHKDCSKHNMGDEALEVPKRLTKTLERLESESVLSDVLRVNAKPITSSKLRLAHNFEHIKELRARNTLLSNTEEEYSAIDADTKMNADSYRAALLAAGAQIQAVDLIAKGGQRVYCHVRPPGHHATHDDAMGFCLLNNVAIGAKYAASLGMRVLIFDFDVHHGNGTESIVGLKEETGLRDDPSKIMYVSCHEQDNFASPPSGHTPPSNVKIFPMKSGTTSNGFRTMVDKQWSPIVDAFQPNLIYISAGFDAHKNDPLSSIQLHSADYEWFTQKCVQWAANEHTKGRIISSLEGGYDIHALSLSLCAHLRALYQHPYEQQVPVIRFTPIKKDPSQEISLRKTRSMTARELKA